MYKKIISSLLLCLLAFPVGVYVMALKKSMNVEAEQMAKDYFVQAEDVEEPCKKEDGSAFTIGYLDIDPYPATGEMLYRFVEQLKENGWIDYKEPLPFDPEDTDARELFRYLAGQDLGPYLRFSDEVNYYVSSEYDGEAYVKKELKKQIKKGAVDLIFCLGTQPANLMINEMGITEVPIMVSGTVDPVGAGLADTEEYSGKSNIWCHTNTGVYRNQLKFYYKSKPFKKLGMVFYDKTIGSYLPYQEAAQELGVEIDYRQIDRTVTEDYYDNLAKLYQELVDEGIDAFLLNSDIIKDEKKIAPLLDVFYQNGIPVYVQNSEYYVEDGATMVVTASDATTQAPFLVQAFSKILHGEEPGSINQKFVTPPYLSLNLEAASLVDFPVSSEMVLSAEKLYEEIK